MTWLDHRRGPPSSRRSLDDLLHAAGSSDGRVREAAVHALALLRDGDALPMLLRRVNDWVPQVRAAARQAVLALLDDGLADAWAEALDDLAALGRGGREDHAALLSRIDAFLARAAGLAALARHESGMSRAARRHVLLVRLQCGDPALRAAAMRGAMVSSDIVCARIAFEALAREDLADALRLAAASPFAGLRTAALRRLPEGARAGGESLAAACFDRSAAVRRLALARLDALPGARIDVIARARHELEARVSGRRIVAALDLLIQLEPALADARCDAATTDAAALVREYAFRRLSGAAEPRRRDAAVVRALGDRSSRVRRLALRAVHRGAMPPAVAELRALARTCPWALGTLAEMTDLLSPWTAVVLACESVAAGEWDPRALAAPLARVRAGCIRPRRIEIEALRAAWAGVRDALLRHGELGGLALAEVAFQDADVLPLPRETT